MISTIFNLVAPLGFILLLIVIIAWLTQHLRYARVNRQNLMQIKATLLIGPKERIVLLEVSEQWIVLGVTAHSITSLLTLPIPVNAHTMSKPQAQSWLERHFNQLS